MKERILLMTMAFIAGYVVPFLCVYASSIIVEDGNSKQIMLAVGSILSVLTGIMVASWQDENGDY